MYKRHDVALKYLVIEVRYAVIADGRISVRSSGDALSSLIHRVSEKSSTSYFAEYFRAGLTDCKNFNGYRVRDNQRTQVYNQFFNF